MKTQIIHKIKLDEGNTTWCDRGFTMNEKGKWTMKFTLDEDFVTCTECLYELKNMRLRYQSRKSFDKVFPVKVKK